MHVNAVADAAIAAAFGQISDSASSGSKRKRWGEEANGTGTSYSFEEFKISVRVSEFDFYFLS
jgi:hypothetical protein